MFLKPVMLAWIGAAAVPLVLHLLARARYRTVDWGAMMFLEGASARPPSRTRQWLLLAVRMAILVLLAVALARPVVRGQWARHADDVRTTAVIVLDRSASMQVETNGRSRFDEARDAALQLLTRLRGGDQVSLLLTGGGDDDQVDTRPTGDLHAVASRLTDLQPSHGQASPAEALARADAIFARYPQDHHALFVITDYQAINWPAAGPGASQPQEADGDMTRLLLLVGSASVPANISIDSVGLVNSPAVRDLPAQVEVTLTNHGTRDRASVPVTLSVDQEARMSLSVPLAAGETRKVRTSVTFNRTGPRVLSARVPEDVLAIDNQATAVVEVSGPLRVLLVSGDEAAPPGQFRRESDFVVQALSAAGERSGGANGRPCAVVEVIEVDRFDSTDLAAYDAIILANVPRFLPTQAQALEQYVFDGGGVIVAPGDRSQVDVYNRVLYRGGSGLLPGRLSPAVGFLGEGGTRLAGLDLGHPVFGFAGQGAGGGHGVVVHRYFPLTPAPQSQVVARYASGALFLVESRLGLGRVLLMTTPLDGDWSTLPLSRFYLLYVQSLVRRAAHRTWPQRNVRVGEPLRQVMAQAVERQRSTVVRPDHRFDRPQVLEGRGRTEVRYRDTQVPGLYQLRLRTGGRTVTSPFMVRRGTEESDLSPLGETRMREVAAAWRLQPIDASARALGPLLDDRLGRQELWGVLLGGVLALVVLELMLAHRPSRPGDARRRFPVGLRRRAAGPATPVAAVLPVLSGWDGALATLQWESLTSLPLAVMVGTALLALVIWRYGQQLRQTPVRWRHALLVLRMLAIAALVVSMLKPVILRPRDGRDTDAIAILVDRSLSMGVHDTARTPAQRVALADGLGMLVPTDRSSAPAELVVRLAQLEAQVDAIVRAQAEVEYARLSGGMTEAARQRVARLQGAFRGEVAILIRQAESLEDAPGVASRVRAIGAAVQFDDAEKLRRLRQAVQSAIQVARQHQATADQRLYASDPLVRQMADDLSALSRLELAELALVDPMHGLLERLGSRRGAAPGLLGVGRSKPDLAIYGFSIGRTLQPLPLHAGGRPVASLQVTADAPGSDLSGGVNRTLQRLRQANLRAVVLLSDGREVGGEGQVISSIMGATVPIFAVLAATPQATRDVVVTQLEMPDSAYAGETVTVRALVRGRRVGNAEVTVHLRGAGQAMSRQVTLERGEAVPVEFELKLDRPGTPEFELRVDAVNAEATLANNVARRRIKVLPEALEVGLFEGWGGWEYHYLREALLRAPGVALREGVLHGGPFPLTAEEILQLDVLVLGEVKVQSLSEAQRRAVHRLVHERGGSLVLLAGDGTALRGWMEDELLGSLLPWQGNETPLWRTWPGTSAGLHPALAAGVNGLEVFGLEDAEGTWEQLPGVFHLLALPPLKPGARALLVEQDTELPILTEERVGSGRVLALAINETWRWRYEGEAAHHARFWQHLVRYAAEPPYQSRSERLKFDADALTIEPGQPLRVRGKRVAPAGEAIEEAELRVRITQEGQTVDELPMVSVGGGRYEREITSLPAGRYTLELVDALRPEDRTLWLPLSVQRTVEPELADLSPDEMLMRRLAEASGGRMLGLEEVRHLPALIEQVLAQGPQTVRQTMWDSGLLFAFVLGCLSLEWALRKQVGLA